MRFVKRLLAVLVCLALVVLLMPGIKVSAAVTEKLKVGDRLEGFKVENVSRSEVYCADVYEFVHEKTGAKAVLVDNGSINRYFTIGFHCPADDRGTAHIIEHLLVEGSEKYPISNTFIQLATKTFLTFANACTGSGYCFYPIASLSEEQLLKFEDLYVDMTLNPLELKDDPTAFYREGCRYEFDENGDLIYNGIIYSEMQAANNINRSSNTNFFKVMAGDGLDAKECGGVPEAISELTFEEAKEYHDRYYVPSNSASFFVGSFDSIAPFLRVLNEAFSKYTDDKVVISDEGFKAPEKFTKKVFSYPVYEGTDTTNGTVITYGVLADKNINLSYMDELCMYLANPASELKMLFLQKLPQATVSVGYEPRFGGNPLMITVSNVNKSDSKKVKKLINKAFKQISKNGFNPYVYESLNESLKLSLGLINESANINQSITMNSLYFWGNTDDTMAFVDIADNEAENFLDDFASGKILSFFKTSILNNKAKGMAVTVPVPGLAEKNAAKTKEKLAKIKEGLTEKEKNDILETTSKLQSENSEETANINDVIGVPDLAKLKYESKKYTISDDTLKNGVRFIETEAGASESISGRVLLDLGGLLQEALPYLPVYISLIDYLDSEDLTKDQIYLSYASNMASCSISTAVYDDNSVRGYTPYINVSFASIEEKLPSVYYTFDQSVRKLDFSDLDRLKAAISQIASARAMSFSANAYSYALIRPLAGENDSTRYYEYINGISLNEKLNEILATLESNPQEVIGKLQMIKDYINDNPAAVVLASGGKSALAANRDAVSTFIGTGKRNEPGSVVYTFPEIGKSEAIIADTDVNYNIIGVGSKDLGFDTVPAELSVVTKLINNGLLYPVLRVQNGAYDFIDSATDDGLSIVSYRDPMLKETFDAYAMIPGFLRQLKLTKSELEEYKLTRLSSLMMPTGEMTDGLTACNRRFANLADDYNEKAIETIKSMKPKDIKKFAKYYDELIANGKTCTIASRTTIEANKDRFDKIIDIYGTK